MTVCVGIEVPGGRVLLGADCALSGAGGVVPARLRKIFRRGNAGFGAAGSWDGMDRLASKLRVSPYENGDPEQWIRNEVRPEILKLLGTKLWVATDVLVAVGGRLFFSGHEGLHGYNAKYGGAIGSGSLPALGALYATQGLDPKKRILVALKAAEIYGDGVSGPFRTMLI